MLFAACRSRDAGASAEASDFAWGPFHDAAVSRPTLAAAALFVSLAACSQTRARDGGAADARLDVTSARDAIASDTFADAYADAGVDAGADTGMDADGDAGDAGWDEACPDPLHRCADACVPWDDCVCGECGHLIPCGDGGCRCLTRCRGYCVALWHDWDNCGACDVACAPGEVCIESVCLPR